jgi:hypothetical protein
MNNPARQQHQPPFPVDIDKKTQKYAAIFAHLALQH